LNILEFSLEFSLLTKKTWTNRINQIFSEPSRKVKMLIMAKHSSFLFMFSQTLLTTNLGITNLSQQTYLGLVANFLNQYLETKGLVFYTTLPALTSQVLETNQNCQIIQTPYFQAPSTISLVVLADQSQLTDLAITDYLLYRFAFAPDPVQEKPVYQIRLLNHTLTPELGLKITARFGFSSLLPSNLEFAGSNLAFKLLNQHLERKGANTYDGKVLTSEQLITTSTDTIRNWGNTSSFTNRSSIASMLDSDQDFQSAIRKWAR
jgi:hypothetical protein